MQNWVKTLFSSTDKLFDILNVGRLIFYTSAGILALYPLLMIINLMMMSESASYFESLGHAAAAIGKPWLVFFGSLVIGFLIAQVAFHTVMYPLFVQAAQDNKDYDPPANNFNYRYPQLKNNYAEEDYQAWLVSEYFRYVEIAAIIPLGFYLGLSGLLGFTLIYLVAFSVPIGSMSAAYPALLVMLLLLVLMPILRYVVWPDYWCKNVLAPTIATYVRAKMALIKGLKDFKPESSAAGAQVAAPAAPVQQPGVGLTYLTGGQS